MSLAKVTIIGNLGRDPETRYTPGGALNIQFSVASSRKWRGSDGQEQENTTWFRVTAWGRLAESLVSLMERNALGKGKQVYIEGRIEAREYEQNGQTRTSLDVNANEVQLLGNRQDNQHGKSGTASGYGMSNDRVEDESLNEVPF